MRDRFRRIARVEKTHGRHGEVVTVPVHGLPSLVGVGLEVAVVPPMLRGTRWHRVLSCRSDGRSGDLVALDGVESLDGAEELVGKWLLAREADLPAGFELHDAPRLVGRAVRDERTGACGVIDEVMVGPANDVWVLRGELGELLLPVIPDVVDHVPCEGDIEIRIPAGLDWEV